MTELEALKKKLAKSRQKLETAILFFDTEAAEWLEEEIHQLESDIKTIENELKEGR